MTRTELTAWRDRNGLTNISAARLLGVSGSGFKKHIGGARPVRERLRRATENIELLLGARIWPSGWLPPSRR